MPFIGNKPSAVPLTSADIADGIITSAKIVDGTIVNADINASSAIAISKISATGTSLQSLRMNSGATALEFATVSGKLKQFVTISDNTEYATNTATTPTAVQSSAADLTITPSSASSRILVCYNWGAIHTSGSSCLGYGVIRFKVGAGSFGDVPPVGANVVAGSSNMHFKVTLESANYMARPITYGFIHHPNTTSAVVYRPFFWTEGGGGHTYINRSERDNANDASGVMFAYAIEIENN